MATSARCRLDNPAVFVCDIQEAFRPAIYEYPSVIATAQKMLKASIVLNIPVHATTQNGARLGGLVSELSVPPDTPIHDKTKFSMMVPSLMTNLQPKSSVALVGIEAHICVTQTALDLLAAGHEPYVLADGVSSCNAGEVPIALARLRQAGVKVTTSESWLYEVLGDAGAVEFKELIKIVKETKDNTKQSVERLCKI